MSALGLSDEPAEEAGRERASAGDGVLRNLTALSMLPAIWLGADPVRIGESLAAALFTMHDPEFVYVAFHQPPGEPICVAQTGRYETDAWLARQLYEPILGWALGHDPQEPMALVGSHGQSISVFVRPLGLDAELGLLAIGLPEGIRYGELHSIGLSIAASQASIAFENARLLRSLRASEEVLRERNGELQRSVKELERIEEELLAANARKDELLGMVSHEFRTPLTIITGNVDLLARRFAQLTVEERRRCFSELRFQSGRLKRLVENMLFVASRDHKEAAPLEPILLQRVLPVLVAGGESMHSPGKVVLSVEPTLPPILANSEYIEQLVVNLVSNSRKYARPGTEVEVSVRSLGDWVLLTVADEGELLDQGRVSQFFEPFYRDPAKAGQSEGTGLGLAVCSQLVRAMGGEIAAEPRPEGGLLVAAKFRALLD